MGDLKNETENGNPYDAGYTFGHKNSPNVTLDVPCDVEFISCPSPTTTSSKMSSISDITTTSPSPTTTSSQMTPTSDITTTSSSPTTRNSQMTSNLENCKCEAEARCTGAGKDQGTNKNKTFLICI